jgi:alkylation response protein AidB-like acyl-CoA dehydrogenase
MGHYKSNLRDIEFNLFEVFGADAVMGTGPYAQLDGETARGVLEEVERLAVGPLAESFADADRNPPTFDVATGTVTLPESFKKSFRALQDGEWFRLDLPEELGGYGASPSLRWAAAELVLGANPAAYMYQAGPGFAAIVHALGTPEQKKFAELMVDRRWGATMVLTEPDAGSDVGAGRTKAFRNDDGTWRIEGVKRFITSGDWDVPENIVHLVLARPEGVEGAGGPGTKGLSLFIVPKFLVGPDGTLGERNGAFVTNVEHKMGLKVSATCEVTFGEKQPAIGYLVGDVHDGIAQMFQVIEYARMMVGTKAISTLSTGYLNALAYAKDRVQGADLTQMTDKAAPRVAITRHPDVRRMLMLQKAYAEGMRALVTLTSSYQDKVGIAEHAGEVDSDAIAMNDLLLPIVKGFGSERSYELLALSLQTLGGSGYLQDYPIEQYIRDAKIDTLYEGTTSIQGQDLFFRKIVRNKGVALATLLGEVQSFAESDAGNGRLKTERAALASALTEVQAMLGVMVGDLTSAAENLPNLYKVGLNTTRLLMSLGDLLVGWLLQRQAVVALDKLSGEVPSRDQAFYEGKIAAAQFFAQTVLPEIAARRVVVETTTLDLMELDEAAF